MSNCCLNCKYFIEPPPGHYEHETRGECRRHAPQPSLYGINFLVHFVADLHGSKFEGRISPNEMDTLVADDDIRMQSWPTVECDDWCGDFALAAADA